MGTDDPPTSPVAAAAGLTLTRWPPRRWIGAALAAAAGAVIVGVPTGIIGTPFYHRMTPVLWWNYPVWAVTAALGGLIAATYIRTAAAPVRRHGAGGAGGGLLSLLAVGCPVCNKVVVGAIGVSGALNVWAPVQPVLGVASVALMWWALRRRLATERACPTRAARAGTPA